MYDLYVDEVFRFIYYRVSDEETAEDLTSQIFIRVWDNLHRYQQRGLPFRAWLFQIARNLLIDHYRTHKETLPLEPHALLEPDPAANVSETVEQRLEAERMLSFLQQLTQDQREVLTLKFINGLSTKEIAKVLKKGQGAIRALQMRGLQALADIIGINDEE